MADHVMQGWPVHMEGFHIKDKQQVTVTTDDKAEASSSVLPISYRHFAHMCQPGDTLFVGRYLVNGADQSSLYLEVGLTKMSKMLQGQHARAIQSIQALLDIFSRLSPVWSACKDMT